MEMSKPLNKEDREDSAIARAAIKADYKKSKGSLRDKDIVKYLDKCYTDYLEYSKDFSLPKDIRLSYLDQATSFKKVLEYIERQTK